MTKKSSSFHEKFIMKKKCFIQITTQKSIIACCGLTLLMTVSCASTQKSDDQATSRNATSATERFLKSNQQFPQSEGLIPQTQFPVPLNASSILLPNATAPFGEAYTPISSIE